MYADEFNRQVGLRIQRLRKQRGFTQESLAEAIDRSTDTVCNIERGFSSTRIETFCRIACVLGMSVAELLDVGVSLPTDRERRKLVDQLVELVATEDRETIEAVTAQTEILLRFKKRANAPRQRLRAS